MRLYNDASPPICEATQFYEVVLPGIFPEPLKFVLPGRSIWAKDDSMKLDQAVALIEAHTKQMNDRYGSVVFDEWAVVSFQENTGRVLNYSGPRKENFQENFAADLQALKTGLLSTKHGTGDFDFARHASGTLFDAFMVLGDELYLICNNTAQSINGITKDSRWLAAQIPFAELADRFRGDPLV